MFRPILLAACLLSTFAPTSRAADAIPPIPRILPPEGLEIPADVRSRLQTRLAATKKRLEVVSDDKLKPDVEVFTKAVDLALLHREFYVERDFAKADWALDEANKRLDLLDKGQSPWTTATGTVVQGYRSSIDSSAQPYGLVIPQDHDFSKPCPLYVWLHGRGDKNTDIHFLQERATRPGQITPPGAIVVHPFGRHCVGWKHAGEIDVLQVVANVQQRYKIASNHVVLIGFSMGGAGAWHIGAHYADRWAAVSPGAGFVDVARYQKIPPNKYPPEYVQKLWGLYDVPDYVRNLFNTTVIAYSGELDKQREAAVIMEEAFKAEGRTLTHLIGPGVEHKYEPKTLEELLSRLRGAVNMRGEDLDEVHVQTRTLRYNKQAWVEIRALEQHWRDSRIDATRSFDATGDRGTFQVSTKNVAQFELDVPGRVSDHQVVIDGQRVAPRIDGLPQVTPHATVSFMKRDGKWQSPGDRQINSLEKRHGLQGPIDDAFMDPFLIVAPSGKSRHAAFDAWVESELAHIRNHWRALMRGDAPIKLDSEITTNDLNMGNLILWGDADSNRWIARLLEHTPLRSHDGKWSLGNTTYDGSKFVPAMIYPGKATGPASLIEPLFGMPKYKSYIVLNSGLTFREAHDRTNSQQNPKLPDWAIIDITQPPNAESPGRIHDADFFDEQWQLKRQPKAP